MLLQYATSEDFYKENPAWYLTRLVQKFLGGWGGFLSSDSLRYATMALAASCLPPEQFGEQRNRHVYNSCTTMVKKTLTTIDDADLLATHILGFLAASGADCLVQQKRMYSILRELLPTDTRSQQRVEGMFACLRPIYVEFFLPGQLTSMDDIKTYVRLFSSVSFALPSRAQRYKMYGEIFDLRPHDIPASSVVQNITPALKCNYIDMVYALPLALEREENSVREWDTYLHFMMTKWRDDVAGPEHRKLLLFSQRVLDDPSIIDQIDDSLLWSCISALGFHLLYLLYDGKTILDGLRSYEYVSTARTLAMFIKITEPTIARDEVTKHDILEALFPPAVALPSATYPSIPPLMYDLC
jgi:hypothetical protein